MWRVVIEERGKRSNYLQTTQPPISYSGALTTRVNLKTIGFEKLKEPPEATFELEPTLSLQFGQDQTPSGTFCRCRQPVKQAEIVQRN